MANIQTYLNNISNAVYGEEVRGSIHDAIDIINKVSEKVATLGTAITSTNSPVTGYYRDSLYLNIQTWDLWKCTGTAWENQGNLKGVNISQVVKKSSSNNVDTYDIRLSNNTSAGEFTVSNSNKIGLGIDVTSTNTSTLIGSTQYYANDIYINSSTWSVWECNGTGWILKGVIEGPKGDTGDKGDKGDTGEQGLKGDPGFSPTITATKEGKVTTLTITDVTGTQSPIQIRDGDDGSGSGDMLKSTYDRDNDGVVDESKTISASSIDTIPKAGSNNFLKSGALYSIIGSLADLDTTDKSNLVAAINEAMQSGSSIDLPLSIANGGTGNSDGYIRTGHNGNSDIGANATIEGLNNEAGGRQAHAEGRSCQATGDYSHAEGLNTWTSSNTEAQHVCGKYNKSNNDTLLEVGNGTASDLNSRSNAFEVTIDGYIRTHNNATKIAFGVDENGNYGYIKAGADTVTPFKNPTGTKQITTNGTHDVTDYASASVNVPGIVPSGTKSITSNGTHDVTNYASASVNVPNSNSGTYQATSRGSSLDMGATNSYRYVNTNSVPNSNSDTFYTSGHGSQDMGATNTYRYVNSNNSYNSGWSDGRSSGYNEGSNECKESVIDGLLDFMSVDFSSGVTNYGDRTVDTYGDIYYLVIARTNKSTKPTISGMSNPNYTYRQRASSVYYWFFKGEATGNITVSNCSDLLAFKIDPALPVTSEEEAVEEG